MLRFLALEAFNTAGRGGGDHLKEICKHGSRLWLKLGR
jgi:hypothetical protein